MSARSNVEPQYPPSSMMTILRCCNSARARHASDRWPTLQVAPPSVMAVASPWGSPRTKGSNPVLSSACHTCARHQCSQAQARVQEQAQAREDRAHPAPRDIAIQSRLAPTAQDWRTLVSTHVTPLCTSASECEASGSRFSRSVPLNKILSCGIIDTARRRSCNPMAPVSTPSIHTRPPVGSIDLKQKQLKKLYLQLHEYKNSTGAGPA